MFICEEKLLGHTHPFRQYSSFVERGSILGEISTRRGSLSAALFVRPASRPPSPTEAEGRPSLCPSDRSK